MRDLKKFYVDGVWSAPSGAETLEVINPATERATAIIALGRAADVDRAVAAARTAFESFSRTSVADRIALLERIIAAYGARYADIAAAITEEMGAPAAFASGPQAGTGIAHFQTMVAVLKSFAFVEHRDGFDLLKEPVGVCGLITPWNWPANQICCKIAPALAAGCTMVLKPSETAPISAHIIAEVLDAAGVPKGVFNLVDGTGPEVGAALAAHPDIDMISFTGSTRAGIEVARAAAPSVKRVAQELGGKSANIILDDADLNQAVPHGVMSVMMNSGQSCNAPTRMLVPHSMMDDVLQIAKSVAETITAGDPMSDRTTIGPVANRTQWNKIQKLLNQGVFEKAQLVVGGPGLPAGVRSGFYVKPTIFGAVSNTMTIAREEIFGPVLVVIPYKDEDDAVGIANDTPYGLSAYVYSGDVERARRVGARLRVGNVHLNGAGVNFAAPFGGYKKSGNGREWGEYGLLEFLETKAVMLPQ